jgi:hypothetical protein
MYAFFFLQPKKGWQAIDSDQMYMRAVAGAAFKETCQLSIHADGDPPQRTHFDGSEITNGYTARALEKWEREWVSSKDKAAKLRGLMPSRPMEPIVMNSEKSEMQYRL